MKMSAADTLVIFGATGDLCARKIYPALYNLVRHGRLAVPVIGVARAGWAREKFIEHVRESVRNAEKTPDAVVLERLAGLLQYVDGDYREAPTFAALHQALGSAQHPLYYLAIPPSLFGYITDVGGLGFEALRARLGVLFELHG